jgi:hypothetical protein
VVWPMLVLFGQPKVNGYDAAYFEAGFLGIPSYKFCTARGLSLPNRMNEGLNLQGRGETSAVHLRSELPLNSR